MATASNDFKLIGPSHTEWNPTVTLSCRLSPEISAVNMEIRWFKETDCVCVYKNRQVTEGRRYKGRVSLFTQELGRGNVSLQLRDCTESDRGHYLCQVTNEDRTEEITVEIGEASSHRPRPAGDDKEEGPSAWRARKEPEGKRMKMEESALLTLSSVDQPSSAVEVFIPELVEKCAEDETKDEYRFLWTHAGQFKCKVTQLMFEMEGEGEVLYRIVSWDSCPLDVLGQKEHAGPLYSINCHKGSIRKLHLPHCETRKNDVKLTVAHVTGGNVEIIQPLQVTGTHVIIAVQGFSLFGVLRDLKFKDYPIEAQVLVFDMNLKGKHRKNKLHMHLLPGNVPAEEVKKQECNMSMSACCQPYIASRATCDLTPGKEYWPVSTNTDHKITIQPEVKKFKSNYGPNYHPTFEVFLNTDVDEVTLGLLDKNKKEVWSRLVLLTDTEAASTKSDTTGADFMKKH